MKEKTTNYYSPEFRERAIRMVREHQDEYTSEWAAIHPFLPRSVVRQRRYVPITVPAQLRYHSITVPGLAIKHLQ